MHAVKNGPESNDIFKDRYVGKGYTCVWIWLYYLSDYIICGYNILFKLGVYWLTLAAKLYEPLISYKPHELHLL